MSYLDIGSIRALRRREDEHTLRESPGQGGGRRRAYEVFMDLGERECPFLARLKRNRGEDGGNGSR